MAHPRGHDPGIARLVRESRFIFTGTVEQEAFSSLSFFPASPTTFVVRVERVHHSARALHNQPGQQVTVVSLEGPAPTRDQRRVFFTNPFLYGETLAVREVANNMQVPEDLDAWQVLLARATEESKVEEFRMHIESAVAVAQGRVTNTRSAHEVPVSEHDPLWWVAEVRVTRVLKGELDGEIHVRFPSSRDIKWFGVPKLKEGDEGVFILHRDGLEVAGATLAIIHPEDFLRSESEDARRVVDLIGPRTSKR
jgi:hypothetical protein